MLLVVAESSGSSPGRQGYKMAVGADGGLSGSIGGGFGGKEDQANAWAAICAVGAQLTKRP